MKLKDPNKAPVGGYYFEYSVPVTPQFPDGVLRYRNNTASGVMGFVKSIRDFMVVNNISVPENLRDYVEDFICTYQPEDRCFYTKKTGDRIGRAIAKTLQFVDSVAKTQLAKKAKKCLGCSGRRTKLNK